VIWPNYEPSLRITNEQFVVLNRTCIKGIKVLHDLSSWNSHRYEKGINSCNETENCLITTKSVGWTWIRCFMRFMISACQLHDSCNLCRFCRFFLALLNPLFEMFQKREKEKEGKKRKRKETSPDHVVSLLYCMRYWSTSPNQIFIGWRIPGWYFR
jgi:hypothetical protein